MKRKEIDEAKERRSAANDPRGLGAEIRSLRNIGALQAEEIERLKAAADVYMAAVRRRDDAEAEVRRLNKAQVEASEAARLYMEHFGGEITRLRADRDDWRKGVGLIASALGLDTLSCVDIAERALEVRADNERLQAEVKRSRCDDGLCRCCAARAR